MGAGLEMPFCSLLDGWMDGWLDVCCLPIGCLHLCICGLGWL